MLTGMGARARDRLFALRRSATARSALAEGGARRDRSVGSDGEPGGALQRQRPRDRDVRDAACAELDHAASRSERSRRHRVRRRGTHASPPSSASRRPRRRASHPDRGSPFARGLQPGRPVLGAIVRRVLHRPVLSLALSVGVLLALALPVLAMDTGTTGVSTLLTASPPSRAFLALDRSFPGTTTEPAEIVVSNASADDVQAALRRLRATLAADPRSATARSRRRRQPRRTPHRADRRRRVLDAGNRAVRQLRNEVVPRTFGGRMRRCSSAARVPRTSITSTL